MKATLFLVVAVWSASVLGAENIDGGPISAVACPLLGESVVLRLSSGVKGAWACDEVRNIIKVATCSQYGSKKPVVTVCSPVGVLDDGRLQYNSDVCGSDPGSQVSIDGVKAFVSSSSFPASVAIAVGSCNDASVAGLEYFY